MNTTSKIRTAAIAAAAASLFIGAGMGTAVAADEAKIHCEGVNGCKGHSDCKTAKSDCKGQNGCKGQGFVEMTAKECDAAKAKMSK
jgi:uncharacterized membrane protein